MKICRRGFLELMGGAGVCAAWGGCRAVFAAASAAGAKWAIVECETRRDTYAEVEASMEYLKSLKV